MTYEESQLSINSNFHDDGKIYIFRWSVSQDMRTQYSETMTDGMQWDPVTGDCLRLMTGGSRHEKVRAESRVAAPDSPW